VRRAASGDLEQLRDEAFCYLTTAGRRTGRPHTVEMWFALDGSTLYMLSGGGGRSDWVRNLRREPAVRVRIGTRRANARARIVDAGSEEDTRARQLLDGKYMGWHEGRRLSSWARTALPVAVDLPRQDG
jgi:deazaflavin-dependent oxidoreductase (nitroreductase family)